MASNIADGVKRLSRVIVTATASVPFSFAPGADFSKLSNDQLHISILVQKAYVKADEKGTEAVAVTMVGATLDSLNYITPSAIFDANHPFIFVIWDYETENIIFMGRIFNPIA